MEMTFFGHVLRTILYISFYNTLHGMCFYFYFRDEYTETQRFVVYNTLEVGKWWALGQGLGLLAPAPAIC